MKQNMHEQIYFRIIQRILANCSPKQLKKLSRKRLTEPAFRRQLVKLYMELKNQNLEIMIPDLRAIKAKALEIEEQLEGEWTRLEYLYITSLNL